MCLRRYSICFPQTKPQLLRIAEILEKADTKLPLVFFTFLSLYNVQAIF